MPIKLGSYDKTTREIRHKMMNLGLNETLSYVLVNEKEAKNYAGYDKKEEFEAIKLLSPLTEDRSTLRCSIITSLYKIYEYNVAHYNKNVSIFEIGKSFYKKDETYNEENKLACLMTGDFYAGINSEKKVDFYIIKGIAEELLDFLGYAGRYSFVVKDNMPKELHPGQSAYIAIVVDKNITAGDIAMQIKKAAGSLLINSEVFDVYTGTGIEEGKKSLAYSLTFGSNDRTLTDEEINAILEKIIDKLSKIGEVRNK